MEKLCISFYFKRVKQFRSTCERRNHTKQRKIAHFCFISILFKYILINLSTICKK
jgi:hypothetical protein